MLRRVKNEKGYTLAESLFQLLIMTLFLHLFVLFFYWKQSLGKEFMDVSLMEWELFSAELQKLLEEVSEIEVVPHGNALRFVNERGVIEVEKSGNVIRKRVDGTGHVPLYTGVEQVLFTFDEYSVWLRVTDLKGVSRERGFAFGLVTE